MAGRSSWEPWALVLKGVSKSKAVSQAFWSGVRKICFDFIDASDWGDYTNADEFFLMLDNFGLRIIKYNTGVSHFFVP